VVEQSWRDDISGLRGLAFLVGLGYHLDSSLLPSGYLAIDLFFVISGFFITNAVQREMIHKNSFSIANFVARRAKRLVPTGAFVAVAVVILNRWFLEPTRHASAISDAIKSVTLRTNIEFHARAENYFYSAAQESVFRHYWSLSLEEQYYLVFPLVAYIGWKARGVLGLKIALSLVFCGSLAANFYVDGTAGFYLMPFRAWALAAGGLVALLHNARTNDSKLVTRGAWAAFLCLMMTFNSTLPAGVVTSVIVTASSCLLIYSVTERSFLGKSLSRLKWVGARSYSLYLWHWPFIVYAKNTNKWGQDGLLIRLAIAAVASFIAAEITYRFVESLRWKPAFSKPSRGIALGIASTLGALAFLIPQTSGSTTAEAITPSIANIVLKKLAQADAGPVRAEILWSDRLPYKCVGYTTPTGCVVGDEDSTTRILLIGDTDTWAEMFSDLVIQEKWLLETYSEIDELSAFKTRHPSLVVYALPNSTSATRAAVKVVGNVLGQQNAPSLFLTRPLLDAGSSCLESAATYEECATPVPDNSAFSEITRSIKNSSFIDTNAWFCETTCPASASGFALSDLDGRLSLNAQSLIKPALLELLLPYEKPVLPDINETSVQKNLPQQLVTNISEVVEDLPQHLWCKAEAEIGDPCLSSINPDEPLIILVGDSHINHWADVIAHVGRTRSYQTLSFPGCMALTQEELLFDDNMKCPGFEDRLEVLLKTLTPEVIISSSKLYTPLSVFDNPAAATSWTARQKAFIERFAPYAKSWLVVGDTPELDLHVPDCLSENRDNVSRCGRPIEIATSLVMRAAEQKLTKDLSRSLGQNIAYVDPAIWLCTKSCPGIRGGLILYRDENHLSMSASFSYTTKIRAALDPLLGH
jgi:peptidoglycan/LPS O-acetylase OafA/YrhL